MVDLSTNIGGVVIKNPVMTASGTFGYGEEMSPYIDLSTFGAIIVKGISLKPRKGNPAPRIVETPSGLINAIGLQNVGLDAFVDEKLPLLKDCGSPVIVNIFGETIDEYCLLAEKLGHVDGIAGIELNISCPNVKKGGMEFGRQPEDAYRLVRAVKHSAKLPIITKLSPNVGDIREMASSVEEAGSDAVSLINTITAMSIDIEKRRPRLFNVIGGLSGPAIRPIAVRMVWEAAGAVDIPVIGIGGIMTYEDAIEFIIAGACAVQIGTANFIDPTIGLKVLKGIKTYLKSHSIQRLSDIIGCIRGQIYTLHKNSNL